MICVNRVIHWEQPWLKVEDALGQIKNIFCVGRNYVDHAKELGNDVPEQPMIFAKSTHALHSAHELLQLPTDMGSVHHELEWVLWIDSDIHSAADFPSAIGGVALGLDLTLRDVQSRLKAAGHPWELAKSFPQSAVLTDFYQVEDWQELLHTSFSLVRQGQILQQGKAEDMIFDFPTLLEYVARYFGLAKGDILFTGTPAGVGPVQPGDELEWRIAEKTIAKTKVQER